MILFEILSLIQAGSSVCKCIVTIIWDMWNFELSTKSGKLDLPSLWSWNYLEPRKGIIMLSWTWRSDLFNECPTFFPSINVLSSIVYKFLFGGQTVEGTRSLVEQLVEGPVLVRQRVFLKMSSNNFNSNCFYKSSFWQ